MAKENKQPYTVFNIFGFLILGLVGLGLFFGLEIDISNSRLFYLMMAVTAVVFFNADMIERLRR